MKALVLNETNFIALKFILFDEKMETEVIEQKQFDEVKMLPYSQLYFNLYNDHFYIMTYNTINDLRCGYYNQSDEISFGEIDINLKFNKDSPLEFLKDFEIEYINFIRNTKYLYYKIINNDENITYHGIIDIESNKVIFNTDKEIIDFKPYSNNSMLAITNESAYKICIIKGDNNECLNECSNNHVFYDISKSNHCFNENDKCNDYVLMPNEICIEKCDENIFYKKDNNECGLCKDLNDEKPYKMINNKGCLSKDELPVNNYKIINSQLLIYNCEENYTFSEGECILICNDLCKTCNIYSGNINDQKCTSCKNENHVLQEGNCIEECTEGYYEEEKQCLKCSDSCKICEDSEKCKVCYDGYYLEENNESKCKKCCDNCETCSKGPEENGNQNCISCDQESMYKYLINDENNLTCVGECPENTYLDNSNLKCQKCVEFCKYCLKSDKCEVCYDGYYLKEKICKKCSDNCETCSKGPGDNGNQNCIKCNQSSLYKYLINDEKNRTCVVVCPTNTYLETKNQTCIEIKKNSKTSINTSNKNYFWIIIIILIIILLIIIIICIYKRNKKQITSEDIEKAFSNNASLH